MEISRKYRTLPCFLVTVQDVVVVALFVYMRYTNKSHGDDVSVMMFSWVNLLLTGYFLLRLLFQLGGLIVKNLVLLAVETGTCYESFISLLQIIGVVRSNNYLFSCTGTFENPGPLGGFLAIGLCISMAEIFLIKRQIESKPASILNRIILGISYLTVILCAIILPSTQSRAAWLSIMVSVFFYCLKMPKTLVWLKAHWLVAITCVIILLSFVFIFKRPSANGRLFAYKMELKSIKKNGFNGVGMGHFSNAYGITQREYFSRNISIRDGELRYIESDRERVCADNPKVGFNDYLQFGIEFGVGPLILMLSLFVLILYRLSRLHSPFYYGMVSMMVFAFFSYPLSLWEFLVLFLVFAAIAGCKSDKSGFSKADSLLFVFSCLIPIAVFHKSAVTVRMLYETEIKWKRQRAIFDSGDYRSYEYCCSQLYPDLQCNCAFLYEYAYSLFENGNIVESEKILRQSLALSGNSLSIILMGDIHKKQGLIAEAEQDYFNSFLALPDRIYPLYKLAVLYYDSHQDEKYQNMVRSIEEFHPRIESKSTNEIRELLKSHRYGDEKTM